MNKKDKEYWSTKLDKFSYKILREAGRERCEEEWRDSGVLRLREGSAQV